MKIESDEFLKHFAEQQWQLASSIDYIHAQRAETYISKGFRRNKRFSQGYCREFKTNNH
jgi:hypothetical protein